VLCVLLLVVYRFVAPPITGVQLQRRIESWIARREYREEKIGRASCRERV
jgi:hypothetical protein